MTGSFSVDVRPRNGKARSVAASPVLSIENLSVAFRVGSSLVDVVRNVDLELRPGEALGLIGESGCGKTTVALAVMGLVGFTGGQVTSGSIRLNGTELVGLAEQRWQQIRGKQIAMIFQQPARCLNPALTIGNQIVEAVRQHERVSRRAALQTALDLLARVRIARPEVKASQYPHQLSGGEAQRVVIAMALACRPAVLIADEPTTALDVTVQDEVVRLLHEIISDTDMAMLYVSHDIALVAQLCDSIAVMYAGEVIERGAAGETLARPLHPYTKGLITALGPTIGNQRRFATIRGSVPTASDLQNLRGCSFHPRCDHVDPDRCCGDRIALIGDECHQWRCVRAIELSQPKTRSQ